MTKKLNLPYAKIKNSNQYIDINNFSENYKSNIICPFCLKDLNFKKGIALNKDGSKRASHFYHLSNCTNKKVDTEPESIQHKNGKEYFFKIFKDIFKGDSKFELIIAQKEYLLKINNIHRIADIYFEFKYDGNIYKKAIEIQFSNISEKELLERHNDYNKLGIDDIWIIGLGYDDKSKILTKYINLATKIGSFQSNFLIFTDGEDSYIPGNMIEIPIGENIFHYVDKKLSNTDTLDLIDFRDYCEYEGETEDIYMKIPISEKNKIISKRNPLGKNIFYYSGECLSESDEFDFINDYGNEEHPYSVLYIYPINKIISRGKFKKLISNDFGKIFFLSKNSLNIYEKSIKEISNKIQKEGERLIKIIKKDTLDPFVIKKALYEEIISVLFEVEFSLIELVDSRRFKNLTTLNNLLYRKKINEVWINYEKLFFFEALNKVLISIDWLGKENIVKSILNLFKNFIKIYKKYAKNLDFNFSEFKEVYDNILENEVETSESQIKYGLRLGIYSLCKKNILQYANNNRLKFIYLHFFENKNRTIRKVRQEIKALEFMKTNKCSKCGGYLEIKISRNFKVYKKCISINFNEPNSKCDYIEWFNG